MTGEQLDEKAIFNIARTISTPDARAEYLHQACGSDSRLMDRVVALLLGYDEQASFLESPAPGFEGGVTIVQPIAERPGTVIGPYKLLQQIGEGGMGVVFMAEQTEPIQRTVALKIIKPGMDTRQVIARFEAERQALAMMDHPNIARVIDANTTDNGLPYFVMGLVKGVPITEYCDVQQLSVRQRLELFTQVCHAVQHAHQKGIIHRDLKPSNVLVAEYDGKPVPKVIDFGVAKATAQRLTERTLFTNYGQIIGTFEYMSPEQARFNQLDVDTRSDIYSLGVLLYELLTGTTPLERRRLETVAFDETLRIIREEEPQRPSTRVSSLSCREKAGVRVSSDSVSIASNRHTDPAKLTKEVRGELDWIAVKALEKDRDRRYETAGELAADIQHYLNDEPVTAAAPSRFYRTSKFVRRNILAASASAGLLLGLVALIVGMAVGLVSQSRQRAAAELQRAEAQLNLATSLHSQGKYSQAEALYREGLNAANSATAEDQQRMARTRLHLAKVVYDQGNPVEAERLFREAFVAYRGAYPPGDPNIAHALITFALLLREQQRFDEAESLLREAYEIYSRAIRKEHRKIGESATHLANVLTTLGRYIEAERLAREAIAQQPFTVPRDDLALAFARLELGRALLAQGKFSDAERELLDAERVLMTTDHFQDGIRAAVALYTTWNQAEPAKGYDVKAHEWIRKLIGTFVRLDQPVVDIPQSSPRGSQ